MAKKKKPPNKCCECGVEIGRRSKRCRRCAPIFDLTRRQKQSVRVAEAWADSEKGSRMRAAHRTPETRHKRSKSSGKRWDDPAERKKVSESQSQLWADLAYRNKMLVVRRGAEFRANAAVKQASLWKDEEYRVRQIAVCATPEIRARAADTMRKTWLTGGMSTPEYRQKLSERMRTIMTAAWKRGDMDGVFKNPSSLELTVAKALDDCGIIYASQHRLEGDGRPYDFFVPAAMMLVEVDGDYWHSRPGAGIRDKQKNALAKERGFALLRIKETELKESGALSIVMERILPICTCICGGTYGSSPR